MSPVNIRLNVTAEQLQLIAERMATALPLAIHRAMWKSLAVVGGMATSKFMVQTGTGAGSKLPGSGAEVNPTRLTIRGGRLARSLMLQAANGTVPTEGIGEVTQQGSGMFVGRIGTRVPYAARHEFGGTFPVTPRARGYFFFRFKETQDEMWLAMALSKMITTPARPFLRPAIEDEQTAEGIRNVFDSEVGNLLSGAAT